MQQFKDSVGRNWIISIDVTAMKRVRGQTGVNLYRLFEQGNKAMAEFLGDPVQIVDVLFALVSEQAAKLGVTDVMFGQSFNGDVLEEAGEALVKELIDFFPKRQRTALARLTEKGKAVTKVTEAKADRALTALEAIPAEELAEMSPDQLRDRLNGKAIGKSSPSSAPASSVSTPEPGASGNS